MENTITCGWRYWLEYDARQKEAEWIGWLRHAYLNPESDNFRSLMLALCVFLCLCALVLV